MEFVKRLYAEAMDPEVLAWDDASNNRCLNAGKCIDIHNPISAFESAKKDKILVPGTQQPIAEVIDHINTPRGPKDRKATTAFFCVGIWNFSKNVELAKDFLRFHFQPENQAKWVEAGHGFNMPFLNNLTNHPVYRSDPQYRHIPDVARADHRGLAAGLGSLHHPRHVRAIRNRPDDARPGDQLGRERNAGNLQQQAADLTVGAGSARGAAADPRGNARVSRARPCYSI